MKKFTSTNEIENLCEAMVKDFFKRKHYTNVTCVDIEAFVQEYLGVPIVYETFAEEDPGRIAFLSDGERPLMVKRNNKLESVVFPHPGGAASRARIRLPFCRSSAVNRRRRGRKMPSIALWL